MTGDERTDGTLIAEAATGNEASFAALVRRHIRAATLFAAQLTGDRDEAEDLVQRAFTIAFEQIKRLDVHRPFSPWLFAVVRRLAAHGRARLARRRRLLERWGPRPAELSRAADNENALLARVDLASAGDALRALSPMQRACFELVLLRDLPPEEVAAMYDISASTVRQHVFRARRALRVVLGEAPEDAERP